MVTYDKMCRAYLSPYWERGGQYKADENDVPVFVSRWNGGAITANIPMIFMQAKTEGRDFFELLDEYLERIRNIHKRTKEYLGEMKASVNPLAFMEGGFYGGHLKANDRIAPLLDAVTFSFGISALNEVQELYNGNDIYHDGDFAYKVLCHINEKVEEFKQKDHILYAIYGTPKHTWAFIQ